MGSSGLDKLANGRTLPALVREDMTFVSHIPDKWRAVTASPEPNTTGTLSGAVVGIGASTQCMRLSRTHRYIDFLKPWAATTAAPITLVVGVVVYPTSQRQLHGNKYCRRAGNLVA